MPLLVTSASGASGNGFGALLAFGSDGSPRGTFIDDDRIADPRGLAVNRKENLLLLNSGADRVLAISPRGLVVRDTGRIEGLNPGGGNFGPDGRYFVGLRSERTIIALPASLDAAIEYLLPPAPYLFLEDLLSMMMAGCSSPQESAPAAKVITAYWCLLRADLCRPSGWWPIPN